MIPQVALFGSLASVVATVLLSAGLGELSSAAPLLGLLPFYALALAIHSKVHLPRLPVTLLPLCLSVVASWTMGMANVNDVSSAMQSVGWRPCQLHLATFADLSKVSPRMMA